MAMVVRSNLMAYNANRQLGMNNSAVSKNLEKLSSGFKINRAADDAAGLAISEKMKAQIKGLEQASANSQDGISLVQTAEGALTEVHDMLNRMTELATKSANGTIQDDVDREAIQNEVDKLNAEIDRVSESTNFNGINLLDGSLSSGTTGAKGKLTNGGAAEVTLKAPAGWTIQFDDGKGDSANSVSVAGNAITVKIGTKDAAQTVSASDLNKLLKDAGVTATVSLDKDIVAAKGEAVTLGAIASAKAAKAKITVGGIDFEADKAGAKTSTIEVVSGGAVGCTVDPANGNIVLSLAGNETKEEINKLLSKAGAGVHATNVGTIAAGGATALAGGAGTGADGLTLQIGDTGDSFNQVTVDVDNMSSTGIGTSGLNVSTQDSAKDAIKTIKDAINKVSTNRSEMGALQNRLEHTINNLDVSAENMTNANSRIRDTDMAKQMMEYTKMNVLTQSAQAMLAQANQNPQSILQLLQ